MENVSFDYKGVGHMKYTIIGKNIEVTEGLKASVQDKLGRLEKFFADDTDVYVTFSVEKERQKIRSWGWGIIWLSF